jgi:ABC-type transporter Mla maintaining outer membrane lipid asymmetry ATPase subunit MlaF
VVFLDHGRIIFRGLPEEMERSAEPVVRKFIELDRIDLNAVLRILSGRSEGMQERKLA